MGDAAALVSARDFFDEMVHRALNERGLQTHVAVHAYLVDLLEFYMNTDNLYDATQEDGKRRIDTLAEMWLKASNTEPPKKNELLKKLGDTSLYISGFFGDSLTRKLVDVDYYVQLGGSAYSSLANYTDDESTALVYEEFSGKFSHFVDVLGFISHESMIQSNKDLLRLYDRYLKTGSELAREKLLEKGILPVDSKASKLKN